MADMIPTSLTNVPASTPGERKVYKLLEELFSEQKDTIIWYELEALGRYSDFIIWMPTHGLLAIEVKDWVKSNFKDINPKYFRGTFYKKDKEISVTNPRIQARDIAMNLIKRCKGNDSLIAKDGPYQGKTLFPITHCVFYTNIYQEDAIKLGLLEDSINEPNKVFFKDDLEYPLAYKDQKKELLRKFYSCFKEFFEFKPLTFSEIKALRYLLFPEIQVNKLENKELFTTDIEDLMALDVHQETTAKNIGTGHRILKGVAGSGKSLVVACRAKYLNAVYPNWNILIVCFNNTLCNHISNMMNEKQIQNLDILTYHGLVKKVTNANLRILDNETQDEYNIRIADILNNYLQTNTSHQKYDAILIDEGQDFAQEWIQSLVNIINPESNSILFCYDPAQNIFNRKRPSWKSFGLEVQGKKPTELMRCYRNTKEILQAAKLFLNSKIQETPLTEDDFDKVLDPDTGECKVGLPPITYQSKNLEDTINLIVQKISSLINKNQAENSIAILIARELSISKVDQLINKAFLKYAPSVRYKFIISTQDKRSLNLKDPSIKILNFESSKGLEFENVFLVGLENMPRLSGKNNSNRDEDTERKLTYVAMTRARQNLFMISNKDSGFFSEISKIIKTNKSEPINRVSESAETNDMPKYEKENSYQAWSEDEEVKLIDAFMEEGKSPKEIAETLQRSIGAIRSRLRKLRLLE